MHNYFLPFLFNFPLLSKKNLDLADFLVLCQTVYKGLHKNILIRELLIKLSLRMNDFRLSSYRKDPESADLTTDEFAKLLAASWQSTEETSLILVKDVIYLIRVIDLEGSSLAEKEFLVDSLKEASKIVGVHYSKLSKSLDYIESNEVKLNNYTIKRVPVFNG